MPKQKITDKEQEAIEQVYAEGLKRLARRTNILIDDALWFKDFIDKPIQMQCLSEIFEHSAKNIAKAAIRHPEYFPEPEKTASEDLPTPDALLSLTIIAGLSEEKDAALFKKWQEMRWPAWKVFEEVQALKYRKPRHSKERGIISLAKIERKNHRSLILTDQHDGKELIGLEGEFEVRLYEPSKEIK